MKTHTSRNVIASAPDWHLSGVNVFTTRLFRELRTRGWETTVVLTNPTTAAAELAPVPDDVKIVRLPPTPNRAIRRRQSLLGEFLTSQAPCVYLPNYDFDTAGILPSLPREVATVGIVHSDDAVYYEFMSDLGAYMDAVVAVSTGIEDELAGRMHGAAPQIVRIPYGVSVRESFPEKPGRPPFRVIYAGRLSQRQKRIMDLAAIIVRIHESGVPVSFDIAGDGPEGSEFEKRIEPAIRAGSVRMHGALSPEATGALFDLSHAMILTSEFEGLPVVLLEGMEAGCVPIVTRIRSGIGELVEDGKTGILFDVGDVDAACAAIRRLADDATATSALASAARARLATSEFTLKHAADSYAALFERVLAARSDATFKHKPGRPFIPRHHRWGARISARWARLTRRADAIKELGL